MQQDLFSFVIVIFDPMLAFLLESVSHELSLIFPLCFSHLPVFPPKFPFSCPYVSTPQ